MQLVSSEGRGSLQHGCRALFLMSSPVEHGRHGITLCTVPGLAPPSSLASSPSIFAQLPVWPSLGRLWPPPCSLCGGWSVGSSGFFFFLVLESAAARVCREAGARVGTNILVRDLDMVPQGRPDSRRLEVVADGLPLFHGAQLAIDTTLVSPVGRDGLPRPRCSREDGAAAPTIARRRKERTYPELTGRLGRAKLVVFACEVGGRWSSET